MLLESSITAADSGHPDARARSAIYGGSFYKAYPTKKDSDVEIWHGYPILNERVNLEVPARVLKQFVISGALTRADYRRLLGSAR